jgi:hypothetical protein
VIIPFNGAEDRWQQAQYVEQYYQGLNLDVVYGWDDSPVWCKGKAIANGLLKTDADRLIINDADMLLPLEAIEEGSKYDWVIPFNRVCNLSESATSRVLSGDLDPFDVEVVEKSDDVEKLRQWFDWAGGIWIIDREIYTAVGGVDMRYTGWGGEDESFVRAVNILHGKAKLLEYTAYHLWHPVHDTRHVYQSRGNWTLYRQYKGRFNNAEKMRELIEPSVLADYLEAK